MNTPAPVVKPTIKIGPAPETKPHVCSNARGGYTCDVCFGRIKS